MTGVEVANALWSLELDRGMFAEIGRPGTSPIPISLISAIRPFHVKHGRRLQMIGRNVYKA